MAATSRDAQSSTHGRWMKPAKQVDDFLNRNKVVASATSASFVSTFAGFPLDSLKSRLQSSRENVPLPRLAAGVVREEGIGGLWRGFPLPLITISVVRTISFTIYTSTKRILNSSPDSVPLLAESLPVDHSSASSYADAGRGNASPVGGLFDIHMNVLNRDRGLDVALTSLIAGGASGAVVCFGSAPFELVKVRRQLEYQIYRDSNPALFQPLKHSVIPPPSNPHSTNPASTIPPSASTITSTPLAGPSQVPPPKPFVPPTTLQAVRLIVSHSGILGLYTGWRLHFVRDTLGTALYFAEYDTMRYYLGRKTKGKGREGEMGEQGEVPGWARSWLPKQLIPFLCGSLAGVTSWAMIYPIDAIKTKAQQRALSGLEPRTPMGQLMRLVRGPDKDNPKPLLTGIARLYRGLGVSMVRSMLTHGLLWTIVDAASTWIDTRPFERLADTLEAK